MELVLLNVCSRLHLAISWESSNIYLDTLGFNSSSGVIRIEKGLLVIVHAWSIENQSLYLTYYMIRKVFTEVEYNVA